MKKSIVMLSPIRSYRRELERLYARRTALDSLIASLEAYSRNKASATTRVGQRKSA